MAKVIIREQGPRGRGVGFDLKRQPGNAAAVLSSVDTGEELVTLRVEPITRKLVVEVNEDGPVEAINRKGAPVVGTAGSGSQGVTWEVKGGKFKAWLKNRNAVELPIADKPGPYTPKEEIPAPLGQAEMVFAVAMAIKLGKHSLLTGPTGTAKTTTYRWIAKQLNYNLVIMPISRGTEAAHLVGEYLPVDEAGRFDWTYGPVSVAAKLSESHPTLLVFDEVNRIGNIAELARIYSLLDDTRMLEIKEKRNADGTVEMLRAGQLYVGATSNPSDSDNADYLGVQDLDPALSSRFTFQPQVGYPPEDIEAIALVQRVPGLRLEEAGKMVTCANRIRKAENVRFPISFRELEAWALALPFYGWKAAAEVAVVTKANPDYHASIRDLVKLNPGA